MTPTQIDAIVGSNDIGECLWVKFVDEFFLAQNVTRQQPKQQKMSAAVAMSHAILRTAANRLMDLRIWRI